MEVPEGYPYKAGLLRFAQKTKTRFIDVVEREIYNLRSIKTGSGLLVKFSITRNNETEYMEHYFQQNNPAILNRNNVKMINDIFRHFIDQVRGEIEAWLQRGSGWVIEGILSAYVDVALYKPFREGSYMPLQKGAKQESNH